MKIIKVVIPILFLAGCAGTKAKVPQPDQELSIDLGAVIQKELDSRDYATSKDVRKTNNRMDKMESRIMRRVTNYLDEYLPSK